MQKGSRHKPETITAISKALKGRALSEEHKRKIGQGNTGHVHTPETRAKMRVARARREKERRKS